MTKAIFMAGIFFFLSLALGALPLVTDKVLFVEETQEYDLQLRELVTGLNHPWGMTWLDPGRLLISERNGGIWLFDGGTLKPVQGLPQDVYQGGQGGWLDLAFSKGWVYLTYARGRRSSNTTALIRFQIQSSPGGALIPQNLETIFLAHPPLASQHHFGAPLAISPQGTVYLGIGERNVRDEAQNKDSTIGAVVRWEEGKKPQMYSFGHRNTQGLYYDQPSQTLYANEHGPQGGDEFNRIEEGKNYGWPIITYGKEYGSGRPIGAGVAREGMEQPLKQWTPSPALSGLTRYYGEVFPAWEGDFLMGALKFQSLYRVSVKGSTAVEEEILLKGRLGRVRSVRVGPDGMVYLLTDEKQGRLIRLER